MKIRRLNVDEAGMAEVVLLTDPIPRHVSLVGWGANNAPAVSWKAADPTAAHLVLRSPPTGKAADPLKVDGPAFRDFIVETLDAWSSCMDSILATPLQPGDRGAQMRAITVQAGARIAAAVKVLGSAAQQAALSHRSAGLKLPSIPMTTTLQGEIDRRVIRSAIEAASAYLLDACLESAKGGSTTEHILSAFAAAADAFAGAASTLPAGVVGAAVAAKSARPNVPGTETPMLTLASLQALIAEDPIKFLETLQAAVVAAKAKGPDGVSVAKKFAWGETGVEPHDPGQILAGLVGFQNGEALQQAIANAVAGVDVAKATGTGVTVAATMRSAFAKFIASEISANPVGELAIAVKSLVAPDVATAVTESLRRVIDGGHMGGGEQDGMDFELPEGTDISLAADLPGLSSAFRQ